MIVILRLDAKLFACRKRQRKSIFTLFLSSIKSSVRFFSSFTCVFSHPLCSAGPESAAGNQLMIESCEVKCVTIRFFETLYSNILIFKVIIMVD